jgi:hypothetical protein
MAKEEQTLLVARCTKVRVVAFSFAFSQTLINFCLSVVKDH